MGSTIKLFTLILLCGTAISSTASVKVSADRDGAVLENTYMARVLKCGNGRLVTEKIVNKRAGTRAEPTQCD